MWVLTKTAPRALRKGCFLESHYFPFKPEYEVSRSGFILILQCRKEWYCARFSSWCSWSSDVSTAKKYLLASGANCLFQVSCCFHSNNYLKLVVHMLQSLTFLCWSFCYPSKFILFLFGKVVFIIFIQPAVSQYPINFLWVFRSYGFWLTQNLTTAMQNSQNPPFCLPLFTYFLHFLMYLPL